MTIREGGSVKRVIFDCDNTMGIPGRDVDDGLALLYLLGRDDIDVVGVTTTHGNSTIQDVNRATSTLSDDLGLDIPVFAGASGPSDLDTEAARFLVHKARELDGKLTLLATGSMTNLKAAQRLDPAFLARVSQIVVMGGVVKPLIVGGKPMAELNFACDPEAAHLVLQAPVPVMVAESHLCLPAFFGEDEWGRLCETQSALFSYVRRKIERWYHGMGGFCMWDLVAALFVTAPELYESRLWVLESTIDDLKTGLLRLNPVDHGSGTDQSMPGIINLPDCIRDVDEFKSNVFQAWEKAAQRVQVQDAVGR